MGNNDHFNFLTPKMAFAQIFKFAPTYLVEVLSQWVILEHWWPKTL